MTDSSAIVGAWIQGLLTFVPTSAVALAAIFGLNSWRKQIREARGIERAEACLVAADEVVAAIRTSRSHVIVSSEDEWAKSTNSIDEMVNRFTVEWIDRAWQSWKGFHREYRRAGFFIRMPDKDIAQEIATCLAELDGADKQARFWEKMADRADPHARAQAARFRSQFLGLPETAEFTTTPSVDPIEQRLRAAMKALENALLPIMGGRHQLAWRDRLRSTFKRMTFHK